MSPGEESRRAWTWLGMAVLTGLVLFQAYAYYFRLELSLGPRVIFQPWALQRGLLMYENLADQHSPLMPLALSVLGPVIPDGLRLAKVVLVGLITLTTLLTFLAARRYAGGAAGLAAAFIFVLWSPAFGFSKLWHETFLAPLYLLWLLGYDPTAPHRSNLRLILLGLLGGVTVLFKQHAAVVFAAFVLWNALTIRLGRGSLLKMVRETVVLCAAAAAPIAALATYHYAQAGTLANFFYWTAAFNLSSGYGGLAALPPTARQIGGLASAGVLLPAALLCLIQMKRQGDKRWLVLGWGLVLLVCASLTSYPRFALFHFQPSAPILAFLTAYVMGYALRRREAGGAAGPRAWFPAGVVAGIAALWIVTAGAAYRPAFQSDAPRKIWEYTDLIPVAGEIRQRIGPTDGFSVLPDDEATANLYYLTRCPPPRFWTFTYPWYMIDPVKRRVLATLQERPPAWIVYFPGRDEFERRAPEIIAYMQEHYQRDAPLHWAQGEGWLYKRRP